jgi:hypothetical protein
LSIFSAQSPLIIRVIEVTAPDEPASQLGAELTSNHSRNHSRTLASTATTWARGVGLGAL